MIPSGNKPPRVSLRLSGGVTLLIFVVAALVAPVCTALLQCAMPCCEADASPASSHTIAGSPCGTECALRSERPAPLRAGATSTSPEVASARLGDGVLTLASRTTDGFTGSSLHSIPPPSPRGTDAPLHVLNSTFLI